jgi:voltage-gated potassium channel
MNFIEGDATQDKILLEAGIEDAKAIVITFNEDAFNVYTVLTARQLNHRLRIITRASNQIAEKKLLSAGANHVVLSEVIGGFYMATLVNQPKAVEFFQLLATVTEESTVQLKELNYKELKAEFKGKSFQHILSQANANVNLIALKDADSKFIINPSHDLVPQKGMSFVILGESVQVANFENHIIQNIQDNNLNA